MQDVIKIPVGANQMTWNFSEIPVRKTADFVDGDESNKK